MEITTSQHNVINRIFPNYNREKSSILAEFGNEIWSDFLVKIFRKGTYRIEHYNGEIRQFKRVK